MSVFGGVALFGLTNQQLPTASSLSEECQDQLYKNNVAMLRNMPFLMWTAPWVLHDFRSARRMHVT